MPSAHFSKTINYLAFNDLLFLICGSLKQVCRVSQWTVDRKTNCVDLRACEPASERAMSTDATLHTKAKKPVWFLRSRSTVPYM